MGQLLWGSPRQVTRQLIGLRLQICESVLKKLATWRREISLPPFSYVSC